MDVLSLNVILPPRDAFSISCFSGERRSRNAATEYRNRRAGDRQIVKERPQRECRGQCQATEGKQQEGR